MFTLHIGMPKTGTTTIQFLLSKNEQALSEMGIIYPKQWRDDEEIAHHLLGLRMLDSSPTVVSEMISEVIDFVSRNRNSKIIISTESLTNILNWEKVDNLVELLLKVESLMPVNLVIFLRRIDDFLESMYLQEVKVGECNDTIEEYISKRENWVKEFFETLSYLQLRRVVKHIKYIPYKKDKDFLPIMLKAMGVPENTNLYKDNYLYLNKKLGLKAQTVLFFLPQIETKIGKQINRRQLIRALNEGVISFTEDIYTYRIMPSLWAKFYHELSLRLALEMRIFEYYECFKGDSISNYKHRELSLDYLTEEDLIKISNWV